MENNRLIQQHNLLESVSDVLNILKQRRPDMSVSITQLEEIQVLLAKDNLSNNELECIDKAIRHLCHLKYLYDICPLELLEGETDQERWLRWGQILDRMQTRANLLCE